MEKKFVWTKDRMDEFAKHYSIPRKDQEILFAFHNAFRKNMNLGIPYLPKHLFAHFSTLMTEDIAGLEYPIRNRPKQPLKELYMIRSRDREFHDKETVYIDLAIDWIFSEVRNPPLVNYNHCIRGYDFHNHWGIISAIQCIDEAFSKKEADALVGYLDKLYGRRQVTTIKKLKLPNEFMCMPFGFSPEYAGYDRIRLHEMKDYPLPFKVEGVFMHGGWVTYRGKGNKEKVLVAD